MQNPGYQLAESTRCIEDDLIACNMYANNLVRLSYSNHTPAFPSQSDLFPSCICTGIKKAMPCKQPALNPDALTFEENFQNQASNHPHDGPQHKGCNNSHKSRHNIRAQQPPEAPLHSAPGAPRLSPRKIS
jgi:hypothetical protein